MSVRGGGLHFVVPLNIRRGPFIIKIGQMTSSLHILILENWRIK